MFNGIRNGCINTPLQVHGVNTCRYGFMTFPHNSLGQYGGSCRPITGNISGFRRNFFEHLRPHIGKFVFQLNVFGNRHPIFSNTRSAITLLQNHISTFWTKRGFYCISQHVYT